MRKICIVPQFRGRGGSRLVILWAVVRPWWHPTSSVMGDPTPKQLSHLIFQFPFHCCFVKKLCRMDFESSLSCKLTWDCNKDSFQLIRRETKTNLIGIETKRRETRASWEVKRLTILAFWSSVKVSRSLHLSSWEGNCELETALLGNNCDNCEEELWQLLLLRPSSKTIVKRSFSKRTIARNAAANQPRETRLCVFFHRDYSNNNSIALIPTMGR